MSLIVLKIVFLNISFDKNLFRIQKLRWQWKNPNAGEGVPQTRIEVQSGLF